MPYKTLKVGVEYSSFEIVLRKRYHYPPDNYQFGFIWSKHTYTDTFSNINT